MRKVYWDNTTYSYPTRVGRTTFVGCQDPFALKVAQEGDKWVFQLPTPVKTTINTKNVKNIFQLNFRFFLLSLFIFFLAFPTFFSMLFLSTPNLQNNNHVNQTNYIFYHIQFQQK